jgi:hypothetical protein
VSSSGAGGDERPPLSISSVNVASRGFANEDSAKHIGHVVGTWVCELSRYIDLARLDGVTIAHDYNIALAELDRGFLPTKPLTPTHDDLVLGVAMTPAVMRVGVVKAHMVFSAESILPLSDELHPLHQQAVYILAHECGHVEDLKHRDICFPGIILQAKVTDYRQQIMGSVAWSIWEEYAASRVSAGFASPTTKQYFDDTLAKSLQCAREESNAAILSWRTHGDIGRVVLEAGAPLSRPLKLAGYLLGQLHGEEASLSDALLTAHALEESTYAARLTKLEVLLSELWKRRGAWAGTEEFDALVTVVQEAFDEGGLVFIKLHDGNYFVQVQCAQETAPK